MFNISSAKGDKRNKQTCLLVLVRWNTDCCITDNNVWFFGQHQRLGHHIDSSHYDSWKKKKKGECQKQRQTKTLELSAIKTYNGHIPHLTPILEPSASNCSEIWNANSLVGVRTRVWSLWGEASSDWRMGRAKAPVFPDPVSARPITSFPEVQRGTDRC